MRVPAIFVFLIALLANISLAQACSCKRPKSIEDHIESSDVIFMGTAIKTVLLPEKIGDEFLEYETTFRVGEILKGDASSHISVLHIKSNGRNCGVTFEAWKKVEVFARRNVDGQLASSHCLLASWHRKRLDWKWEDYRKALGKE